MAPNAPSPEYFSDASLHGLILGVGEAGAIEEVYEAALACLEDSLGVSRAAILIFDHQGIMRFKAWRNLSRAYMAAVEGNSPWSRDVGKAEPVLIADARTEPALAPLAAAIEAEGLQAMASFPLTMAGKVLGKFILYYDKPHAFTDTEIATARTIAAQIAFVLDQREQRAHLEAMFSSPVIGIAELDTSGRFRSVNARFCELTGRSESELTKLTCFDITHPDDRHETEQWLHSLAQGQSHFVLEKRYLCPDGTVIWVSKSVSAIRGEEERYNGAIAFVSDITDQKLAEAGLRASEQRYRELVGGLGLAVYTTDAEGTITLYNDEAAKIWGVEPRIGEDKWCGSWRILTPEGDDLPLDQCPMAVALREDLPVRGVELIIERPDGQRHHVLPHPTPMHDDQGRLIGAVNVLVDITELKRAEAEAARAYELKDQFLSLVSHELRTPLATILGNGVLLMKRSNLISEEDKHRAYTDIVAETEKLHDSIENLLLMTRLDSSMLEIEAMSLAHVVRKAVQDYQKVTPDRTLRLEVAEVPPALGQETLITLVLRNLLSNALKYSPRDTEVEVTVCRSADGRPEVRVEDRGIGLEPEDVANLFTPFYRSQKAKDSASGLGLGLAVCQRVMEVQNGTISAGSRPGGGTSFCFSLPEADESPLA